jgi:hypothetical protein
MTLSTFLLLHSFVLVIGMIVATSGSGRVELRND